MEDDSYGPLVSENEKDPVALIDLTNDADSKTKPLADDFEAMKPLAFPPILEAPKTLAEGSHTWEVSGYRSLPKRVQGPIFEVGGYPWRVLMFPHGNNVDQASLYLEHGFQQAKPPEDFVCCVQFSIVMWNPRKPDLWIIHSATHRFTSEEADWGFTRFVELRKLYGLSYDGRGHPLLENEEINITSYVRVVEDETGVLWHNFHNYDSKKETGLVGLKNQGATCYLNSLIQSLYFTNIFRKAIYQIPTQDEVDTFQNSAYTLQRLFYQLQESQSAVSTSELTKSFGWETRHIFEQQDVQELSRKLMERMEEKMKGTTAENVLTELFCGKVRTYISCINVDYVSARVEDFWDIQLNVQGTPSMEQSLADYIKTEIMDGENKYYAGDDHKLQDAEKGVIFESFPEVLNLQLKRFEYNVELDAMTKVNTRYEYPEQFDASPYLSKEADKSESWIYRLHSVLVHHGDLNAGHYYAFIRPELEGCFYKFDDDRVTRATMREVLEDNFGGPQLNNVGEPQVDLKNRPILRQSSAYMLVYIRETRVKRVLLPVTADDTPPHIQQRLDEEAAKRLAKQKEQQESHLYINVQVITNSTFCHFHGTDLAVWDTDPAKDLSAPRHFRLLKKDTLKHLAELVAAENDQNPNHIRFWCMVNRQNKTCRPDVPITDYDMTIEGAYKQVLGNKPTELRVWAEVAAGVDSDGNAVWPNEQNAATSRGEKIVLFLKHFDVEEQKLFGAGHIYINREKRVEELVPAILSKIGWPASTPLKLFEEIKPTMVEVMKPKQSLRAAELQDGDIVCFQVPAGEPIPSKISQDTTTADNTHLDGAKIIAGPTESLSGTTLMSKDSGISVTDDAATITDATTKPLKIDVSSGPLIDDAMAFYDFLAHRKTVIFIPHKSHKDKPSFELELSVKNTYDQVVEKLAPHLGIPPTHMKLFTITKAGEPKTAVKRTHNLTLYNIFFPAYGAFGTSNQKPDSLMYQILDISLAELETKRLMKVYWTSEGVTTEEPYEIYVAKNGTVEDLIDALITKAKLESQETAGRIRVYEVNQNKIHRILLPGHILSNTTEYVTIVAERVPADDQLLNETGNPDGSPCFISVFHFDKDPSKTHGTPFTFPLAEGEEFRDTKKRLEIKTGLKGKNLEKVKFALVKKSAYSKPKYITDDDVLWDLARIGDDYLGMDHVDRTRAARNGTQDLFLK